MPIDKPQFVVCAAIRNHQGRIICGARHYDTIMRSQAASDHNPIDADWFHSDQGFIDQFGNFLTRLEACEIARKTGQIKHRCGGDDDLLFSENLY